MSNGKTMILGEAGEHLVKAHLNTLEIEAGIVGGTHVDVIALIGGRWRTFQVKSSKDSRAFCGGGYWVREGLSERKQFSEYEVDAFVFCFLPAPYPYYIAKEAMSDRINFPHYAFSRSCRDDSFVELLRRWGVDSATKTNGAGQRDFFKNGNDYEPPTLFSQEEDKHEQPRISEETHRADR